MPISGTKTVSLYWAASSRAFSNSTFSSSSTGRPSTCETTFESIWVSCCFCSSSCLETVWRQSIWTLNQTENFFIASTLSSCCSINKVNLFLSSSLLFFYTSFISSVIQSCWFFIYISSSVFFFSQTLDIAAFTFLTFSGLSNKFLIILSFSIFYNKK